MNTKEYDFSRLTVEYWNDDDDDDTVYRKFEDGIITSELVELITQTINDETLIVLQFTFNKNERFGVELEDGLSGYDFLAGIYFTLNGKYISYINRNCDDKTLVGVGQGEVPVMCTCDDKDMVLNIIFSFLKTGKSPEGVDWIVSSEIPNL